MTLKMRNAITVRGRSPSGWARSLMLLPPAVLLKFAISSDYSGGVFVTPYVLAK